MVDAVSARSDVTIHAGEVVGLVGLRGAGQENDRSRAVRRCADHAAAASCSTATRYAAASPREAMAAASIWSAPTGSANRSMPNLTVRENLFLNPVAAGLSLFSYLAPGRENAGRVELGRAGRACGRTIRRCRSSSCRAAISRRSWSAAGCISARKVYVFEDPTAGVDVGAKAEIYRLFDVALQAGRRDPHRLDRFRGGRQGLSPRAGVRSRPRRRRARRRRSVGRESACRRVRAASGTRRHSDGPPHRAGRWRCSPLNPTRSSRRGRNLPACRAGERSCACCRSTACRS